MKIAICGITGAVGQETLGCLKELNFKISKLSCFASNKSAGKIIDTPYGKQTIEAFSMDACKNFDVVFLCISGDFSAKYAKDLTKQNKYIIDSSSHFRYDDDVPLIIPEINGHLAKNASLIANPNCTTIILAMVLYPIYKEFGLKKVIVSTYQATSGGGREAMEELRNETTKYLAGEQVTCQKFTHPIPFNLIPAVDVFLENGYTKEEMKVVWETHKIFDDNSFKISTTAVRIPTFRAHSESATIETVKPVDIDLVRTIIKNAKGVKLVDNPAKNEYPMPLTSSKKFDVEAGRFRYNTVFDEYGLDFFVSGDQLLKGAALNAVQIARAIL